MFKNAACLFPLGPMLFDLWEIEQLSGNLQGMPGNDRKWFRSLQKCHRMCWKLNTPFWTNTQAAKSNMEDHNFTKKEKSLVSTIGWKSYCETIFDYRGMLYQHDVPSKTMVNGENYCCVWQKLKEHITKETLDIKNMGILQQDYVRPYISEYVRNFLKRKNITTISHPAYRVITLTSQFLLAYLTGWRLMYTLLLSSIDFSYFIQFASNFFV